MINISLFVGSLLAFLASESLTLWFVSRRKVEPIYSRKRKLVIIIGCCLSLLFVWLIAVSLISCTAAFPCAPIIIVSEILYAIPLACIIYMGLRYHRGTQAPVLKSTRPGNQLTKQPSMSFLRHRQPEAGSEGSDDEDTKDTSDLRSKQLTFALVLLGMLLPSFTAIVALGDPGFSSITYSCPSPCPISAGITTLIMFSVFIRDFVVTAVWAAISFKNRRRRDPLLLKRSFNRLCVASLLQFLIEVTMMSLSMVGIHGADNYLMQRIIAMTPLIATALFELLLMPLKRSMAVEKIVNRRTLIRRQSSRLLNIPIAHLEDFLLFSPLHEKLFMRHLEKQYCSENLKFWRKATDFEHAYESIEVAIAEAKSSTYVHDVGADVEEALNMSNQEDSSLREMAWDMFMEFLRYEKR